MKSIALYVESIINRVKKDGDRALEYYTYKYDKIAIGVNKHKVTRAEIVNSRKLICPDLQKSLKRAADNIKAFHEAEKKNISSGWSIKQSGLSVGQLFNPIEKAGIYVPGGRYPYPSTVLMAAIPAKAAGVKKIIMATPPRGLTPAVLYAAYLAGINDVYRVGGPAVIAAMAYGTKNIPKVDMIVGPGNKYVNEAKRQVIGQVGIDSLAGPSEVAIIADKSANAQFIAEDLLAQAEHDPDARGFVFSDSAKLINDIKKSGKYGKQVKIVKCSISKAVDEVNKIAPEHLEVMVSNPDKVVRSIENAGAIFVGNSTPTAVGDYWAGPSHVLPTGGCARFSSGLSVATFLKRSSYVRCSKEYIRNHEKNIELLAEAEGLKHHRKSIKIRGAK